MPGPQTLRPYQEAGIGKILDAWRSGARGVLAVAPTGSGKTSIFSSLIHRSKANAVILVHRRELAIQAANRLTEFGVDFGFIMAGMQRRPHAPVQIASVQTLVRRAVPKASLVICDEAHLSTANTWTQILEQYPTAKILGVTATPWRMSGKPLIGNYDASVVIATPNELRQQGFLCDYVGFSYKAPDLSEVKTTGGDYNEKQSADAMREPQIVANIVEKWLAHASDLSTVVFAVTVEHSQELCAQFVAAGVAAEHLDGKTPLFQREAILARVNSGVTRVLCNVGVAVEGLDIPRLKCCVLARPTKSLARYIQMAGRVRRPWNGVRCRIHDHAFNLKHGLPDDDRDYSLHAVEAKPLPVTQCPTCLANYRGPSCSFCGSPEGAEIRERLELATVADAEMIEFDSAATAAIAASTPAPIKQPVEVRWTDVGREVVGVYERTWETQQSFGKVQNYYFKGVDGARDHTFTGTSVLNQQMKKVPIGTLTKVMFIATTPLSGGMLRKEFRVQKDNGTPVELTCEVCGSNMPPSIRGPAKKFCSQKCREKERRSDPEKQAARMEAQRERRSAASESAVADV